ncbi:hypothetical protein BFJ68_g432 [Fusarium oxysporum]|uniref:Uncharacterized protein n=1 Tax=Fusarium oxysporum TaxID=5507 RepID=A0A420S942_FUSOX|nr:hypothetical protein BFJ68_g432 [Fusarium oxysporum]
MPKKGCSTIGDHASLGPTKSETYSDKPVYCREPAFFLGGDFPKELGKGPMGPNINGIFGIGPPGSSVFSALKTFTPTLWNLVKP